MRLTRRNLLALVATSFAAPAFSQALGANSPLSQRSIGSPTAPVTAIECFSLTCVHCAHFATVVMPEVKPKLVDTGKLQIIYHDFPLDQVALMAAQVARSLPPEQYYPFIEALFASQDVWAFAPNVDSAAELQQYAALAGMDATDFNAAVNNTALKNFILNEEQQAETQWHVNATPTFIINGKIIPGAMEYPDFAAAVAQASG